MTMIAAAVIGSAVIGGAVSAYSSNKASKAAGKASDEQIAFSKEMADRSRDDINKFLPQATDARNEGFQQQMNFLNKTLPTTMDMFQQGNVGARAPNGSAAANRTDTASRNREVVLCRDLWGLCRWQNLHRNEI